MKHDWEYKKLGEVCDFERGLTYSKNDESSLPTENKVFRSNNVDLETKKIVLDDLKYLVSDFVIPDTKMVKPQTILMCMSNGSMQHVGKVAHIEEKYDAAFGGFMGLLIPKQNCRSKYLFYFLNSSTYRHFLLSIANGINITNLKFSDLRNLNLPIPPLPIQQQIVAELDKVSEIIEKKKQQVKELDNLAQSIFYDMFGDPVENEKGWEVKLWKSFGKITNGFAFNSKLFRSDGIPVLKIGNINTGTLRLENVSYYDYSNNLIKYEVYPNDIVLSLTGTAGKDDYGNVCIIPDNGISKYYLNQRNAKLDSNGVLLNLLIKHIFANPHFKKELTKGSNGIRQGNILNKDIENLRIPIPPLPLQQTFAQKIEAIEKQKELITASIKEAQTLFDARMDYWFGE